MGKAHTKMDEKAIPKNDSYGALRYRTPTSPTTIAPPHPKKAIAPPHPKSDRTPPHSQKAIALPTSPKAILSKNQPAKDFLNV